MTKDPQSLQIFCQRFVAFPRVHSPNRFHSFALSFLRHLISLAFPFHCTFQISCPFWFIPPKAPPIMPLCSPIPRFISMRTLYWPLYCPLFMVNVPSPIVLLSWRDVVTVIWPTTAVGLSVKLSLGPATSAFMV